MVHTSSTVIALHVATFGKGTRPEHNNTGTSNAREKHVFARALEFLLPCGTIASTHWHICALYAFGHW